MKSIKIIAAGLFLGFAALAVTPGAVLAILIDRGTTTFADASGLEWLDVSVSNGRSVIDVSSRFGAGQEFEGWR